MSTRPAEVTVLVVRWARPGARARRRCLLLSGGTVAALIGVASGMPNRARTRSEHRRFRERGLVVASPPLIDIDRVLPLHFDNGPAAVASPRPTDCAPWRRPPSVAHFWRRATTPTTLQVLGEGRTGGREQRGKLSHRPRASRDQLESHSRRTSPVREAVLLLPAGVSPILGKPATASRRSRGAGVGTEPQDYRRPRWWSGGLVPATGRRRRTGRSGLRGGCARPCRRPWRPRQPPNPRPLRSGRHRPRSSVRPGDDRSSEAPSS